jgi:hypothetical protein
MKNLFLLPTDKPSRLILNSNNKLLLTIQMLPKDSEIGCYPQNIYITNDEEIEEGNWCFDIISNCSYKAGISSKTKWTNHKKIILTTDAQLIKDGVQAIDDTFLEWFVKNPSCEFVEVDKYHQRGDISFKDRYKIIIPQEEPEKVEVDWSGFPQATKDTVGYVEPKHETLEEAAEKYENSFNEPNGTESVDFIAGAKWQSERMYSEEDLRKAFHVGRLYQGREGDTTFEEWFEQFKKKA